MNPNVTDGLVLVINDLQRRAGEWRQGIAEGDFGAPVPSSWPLNTMQPCLLSADGRLIEAAALLKRGRGSMSFDAPSEFHNVVQFKKPVSRDELVHALAQMPGLRSEALPDFMELWSQGGGILDEDTAAAMEFILRNGRADIWDALNAINQLIRLQGKKQLPNAAEIMALQKDAHGVAVSASKLSRRAIWLPDRFMDNPQDYVLAVRDALNEIRETQILRENQILDYDSHVLPGWENLRSYSTGVVVHAQRGASHIGPRTLYVMNLDHQRVETAVGVDLLYYHEAFDCFVLLQYKRFATSGESHRGRLYFRPDDDDHLKHQVSKLKQLRDGDDVGTLRSYRLNVRAGNVKICDPTVYYPSSTELIEGLYVPVDLFHRIDWGERIVPDKSRYLNSTQFVDLLSKSVMGG